MVRPLTILLERLIIRVYGMRRLRLRMDGDHIDGRHNLIPALLRQGIWRPIPDQCCLHQLGYDYFLITRADSTLVSTSVKIISEAERPMHKVNSRRFQFSSSANTWCISWSSRVFDEGTKTKGSM